MTVLAYFIYLLRNSQKHSWSDSNHNRKTSRQCTDRYLQCRVHCSALQVHFIPDCQY